MARQLVHPCRTGNPGVVLHACEGMDSDMTLCGEIVDKDTIGQPWGFRALCTLCYPLKDPEDALVPAPKRVQIISGREKWPDSSEKVLRLSKEEEEELWSPGVPDRSA